VQNIIKVLKKFIKKNGRRLFKSRQLQILSKFAADIFECVLTVFIRDDCDDKHCRFCWGEEENVEDPLILACKCRGSVGLIHYYCLKNWIST
jgi:hypothetical protein